MSIQSRLDIATDLNKTIRAEIDTGSVTTQYLKQGIKLIEDNNKLLEYGINYKGNEAHAFMFLQAAIEDLLIVISAVAKFNNYAKWQNPDFDDAYSGMSPECPYPE